MRFTVLIVDDNEINRLNLKLLLKDSYGIAEAGDVEEAETILASQHVDLLVLDLALPPEPDNPEVGLHYLEQLHRDNPDLLVVVITGHDARKVAVRARSAGAVDFFGKPFDPDEVHATVDRALKVRWQQLREQELARTLQDRMEQDLLGSSRAMRELRELISRVAPAPSTVLIQGESGSGKELVARRLHAASPRREGPFVVVNCSATNPDLLESSLFGHEKGAFAGATCRRLGWFERATGGILFLDEISDLPAGVQAKLLRVLETGRFARLGGEAEFTADVRILCSTRKPLEELLQVGLFRDDLYYRINVVNIHIPPLREHAEDIPLLAEHFLERKALLCNKNVSSISDAAMRQLCDYTWPGNVRELENVIERAVVLATGERIDRIPALAAAARERTGEDLIDAWIEQLPENGVDAGQLLNALEKRLVLAALDRCGGIKTRAGRWLGFGERAKDKMRYLCDKYNIRAGGDE